MTPDSPDSPSPQAAPGADHGAVVSTPDRDAFARDVREGLAGAPKTLPCKYLYDEEGSRLFDRICDVEEYYPTRTELGLIAENAGAIAEAAGPGPEVVEFGSGASQKIRLLLDALDDRASYVAIDISGEFLTESCETLAEAYPTIPIVPVCADYTRPMTLPETPAPGRRLGFFPGSTLGNFEPPEARAFLARARETLGDGAAFVVGIDLVKPAEVLEAAYDDSAGVTAAFNLNLLDRINREVGATFDRARFHHEARWNPDESRVEMHLVSDADQIVTVDGARVAFAEGESIHTENSYKYTIDGFRALAEAAGWAPAASWRDARDLFSLHLLEAA